MSLVNLHIARNQHKSNSAFNAALSGLELGKYIVANTPSTKITNRNTVSDAEAYEIWKSLCSKLQSLKSNSMIVTTPSCFTDENGSGRQIYANAIYFAGSEESLSIRFYYYDSDPRQIILSSTGRSGKISRQVNLDVEIAKSADILNYAVASRGRIWIAQNSVIYGPVLSTWNRPEIGAGILKSADATIYGSLKYADGFELDMPGLKTEDYDTSEYKVYCKRIGLPDRFQSEYFPHASKDYTRPKTTSSKQYNRKVYENKVFSNVKIPKGYHALFVNCTFKKVLFIEANALSSQLSNMTNNIRFENCTFNGPIVTDVPNETNHWSWWTRNVLYFTGESIFDNQSTMPETTIFAPNFNVNLGNTGMMETGGGNILKGVVIGGIVDVRGDADIFGTIISIYDTSAHSIGYFTNIGSAVDGGGESSNYAEGEITITPNPDQLLPNGIKSPIVIRTLNESYSEGASALVKRPSDR